MRVPRRSVDAAAAQTAPGFALPSSAPSSSTTGVLPAGNSTGVRTAILADFDGPIQWRTAHGCHPPEWGPVR